MRRAAFLALAALLAAACGPHPPATPQARGRKVYLERCASCHGEGLEGKRTAPPLTRLHRHWDAARLAAYLKDPGPVVQHDPRLLHLSGEYTLRMPAFPDLPPSERDDLLAFLLSPVSGKH